MKRNYILVLTAILMLTACQQTETITTVHKKTPVALTETKKAEQKPSTTQSESNKKSSENKTTKATVERVIDGDTLKVNMNGKTETIRLLLVDTPESVHPDKKPQAFAIEASNFTKSFLPKGTKVDVELGKSERDKYNRLLAYVFIHKQMVNEVLLEKGYARVAYVFAPNTKYIDEFRAIEKEAKEKKRKVWSIKNYATDRGFNDAVVKKK